MARDETTRKDPFADAPAHGRERVRFRVTESKLAGKRITGSVVSDDEIIMENGYESPQKFRDAELSMPMTATFYVLFLRKYHLAPCAQDLSTLEIAIRKNLKLARSIGLPWIFRDTQAATSHAQGLDGWILHPRPATEWLLSMPTERPLVPEELRDSLEGREPPATPAATGKRKAGRPREHDWDGAREFVRRHLAQHQLPETKARVIELVAEWFAKNDGPKVPDKRDIDRNVVDALYAGK